MNFNEKLISLRKSKGLSQEELGAELNVSRQTISKWESCQSYPDFQRLVLLSDFFGLTLDELIKDIDVQEVREKNINEERLNSIYTDKENAKKIIKWSAILAPIYGFLRRNGTYLNGCGKRTNRSWLSCSAVGRSF